MKSTIKKRIYYDDTDAGGVVYHANYLRYMDHARSEFISQRGFDFHVLQEQENLSYVVANIDIQYRRPCRLGDDIEVSAEIHKLGTTSVQFLQTVTLKSKHSDTLNGELCAEAIVTVVIVNLNTMKPTRIPAKLKEAMNK